MITYGNVFDDERAQIVPSVFSGCDYIQSPAPACSGFDLYNNSSNFLLSSNFDRDELDRLLDDGQVPYCGYNNQRINNMTANNNGYDFMQIKQEPKSLIECLNSSPVRSNMQQQQTCTFSQQPHPVPVQEAVNQHEVAYALAKDKMEQVQQLALRQALTDVHNACKVLQISPEPMFWTKEQTRAWLVWTCQHYNLAHCVDLRQFDFDGFHLTLLQEADFKKLAPACGEFLWSILDIWRTASGIKMESDMDGYGCQQQQHQSILTTTPELNSGNICHEGFNFGNCGTPVLSSAGSYDGPYSNCSLSMSITGSPGSCGESCGDSGYENETISDDGVSSLDGDMDHNMDTSGGSHTHLWQFLKELLSKPHLYASAIRWVDRSKGIFKIEDSVRVARCWGKRKNRPAMNYDKLSRSIRQYYKKGIMKKTERSQRLVYQFCAAYAH